MSRFPVGKYDAFFIGEVVPASLFFARRAVVRFVDTAGVLSRFMQGLPASCFFGGLHSARMKRGIWKTLSSNPDGLDAGRTIRFFRPQRNRNLFSFFQSGFDTPRGDPPWEVASIVIKRRKTARIIDVLNVRENPTHTISLKFLHDIVI